MTARAAAPRALQERERGVTIDVGITHFESSHALWTLLDAPGPFKHVLVFAARALNAIGEFQVTRSRW